MSKVVPLIAFGITFFVGGLYWSLWDGSRDYISQYVVQDQYYQLIIWVWQVIPGIILMVGIICLVAAGVLATRQRVVYE